ncbi:MAG: protein kinase, partial [Gemmatimonadetes bacterium]|nr:serine/threonine protein kinase [Gemmatimonadota bacterium]NIQ54042.1 serine/threonine protein kinase [Gemmatimonadota bacterium]NIU74226.1 protein kinase [Gammaproteobacteria bacterium]NIX44250.1 protein kinase [Gemmatimonadota bacterium]NIY08469.1 protein kinase [Gemmatimonadota bacterium]
QILASLDHPNIARLLDGGVTPDGRPFLVMEHVDGLPIDLYADRMRLTIEERLELFLTVCHAVQHAHQNLVVHRDLKPSNILVTARGEVKLLDFGIAKLLNPALGPSQSPHTAGEQRALTPEYASPEQIRGEALNTASDVYSLGVVLYRLLTGRHPYQLDPGSMHSIVDVVTHRDPCRPSECFDPRAGGRDPSVAERATARRASRERLRRRLHGDLDAIVLRTLRKEPADRYGSAELLAQDLENHANGRPVRARKGARGYRLRAFLRRHRYQVAAGALVMLSLTVGAGAAAWQARVAGTERDRAEDALRQSEEITAFLMDLFAVSDPGEARPDEVTAADLMRRGVSRVEALSSQPLVQARMFGVIGELNAQLGQHEQAVDLLRRALAGKVTELGMESPETAEAMNQLGQAYARRARYDDARSLHEEALRIQQAVLGPADPAVAATLMDLARIEFDLHQRETLLRRAFRIQEAALGPDDRPVTTTLLTLA